MPRGSHAGYDIYGDPRLHPIPRLAVGFDLDMTLVDSRPGIVATLAALAERVGRGRARPTRPARRAPTQQPRPRVRRPLRRRRASPSPTGSARSTWTSACPAPRCSPARRSGRRGARPALARDRDHGQVRAQRAPLPRPRRTRRSTPVFGWRHGPAKAETLIEQRRTRLRRRHRRRHGRGAGCGDPLASGSPPVRTTPRSCVAAGADVVLSSLVEFPAWWEALRPAR